MSLWWLETKATEKQSPVPTQASTLVSHFSAQEHQGGLQQLLKGRVSPLEITANTPLGQLHSLWAAPRAQWALTRLGRRSLCSSNGECKNVNSMEYRELIVAWL